MVFSVEGPVVVSIGQVIKSFLVEAARVVSMGDVSEHSGISQISRWNAP